MVKKMSAKQTYIRAKIDHQLKQDTERIFKHLGLTTTEAIRIFLAQVRIHGGLPFRVEINPRPEENDDLLLPNEMRQAAMDEFYDD